MENVKKTARAVIIINNKIILIKRKKYKNGNIINEYYTIPGGHVEGNESFEETVIREIKEELGISIKIKKKLIRLYSEELNKDEIFYECEYLDGKIGTGIGEEWTNPDIEKYGSYEILQLTIDEIEKINLLPLKLKELLLKEYKF